MNKNSNGYCLKVNVNVNGDVNVCEDENEY